MNRCLLGLAALLAAGCDDHLFPAPASSGGVDASWTGVQAFMSDNCYSCHGAERGPVNGNLHFPDDIEADLANLNEPATDYDELVVPGDSANSVLWKALTGADGYAKMPLGQSEVLPDAHFVQEWIDAGASLD